MVTLRKATLKSCGIDDYVSVADISEPIDWTIALTAVEPPFVPPLPTVADFGTLQMEIDADLMVDDDDLDLELSVDDGIEDDEGNDLMVMPDDDNLEVEE